MFKIRVSVVVLALPTHELVLQRRDAFAPTSPHKLTFFGGRCEDQESEIDAAIRELQEETALHISRNELSLLHTVTNDNVTIFAYFATISKMPSKVYEGLYAEKHELESLMQRDDIAPVSRLVLQSMKKEILWHLESQT